MFLKKYISGIFKARVATEDEKMLKKCLEKVQNETFNPSEKELIEIVAMCKAHIHQRHIVLLVCHIISNLALNEQFALFLIQYKTAKYLQRILKVYLNDSKVVWKCTSAIWNLCRPNQHPADCIPWNLPYTVYQALILNANNSRTVHTCFGALSNLALVKAEVFGECIDEEKIRFMLETAWRYRRSKSITGHFAAMVANMAVITDIAQMCVNNGYIPLLVHTMKLKQDEESVKHAVAALHNLSDCESFVDCIVSCKGVEHLHTAKNHYDSSNDIYSFIDGIFELSSMPIDIQSSWFMAVGKADIMTVVKMLRGHADVNVSINGKTALQVAAEANRGSVVELLLAAGAQEKSIENIQTEGTQLAQFIKQGKTIRKESQATLTNCLKTSKTCTENKVCTDVLSLVVDHVHGFDLLVTLDAADKLEDCAMDIESSY